MSALPSFHTKAVASKKADKESALDGRDRADAFLMALDELLEPQDEETQPAPL